MQEALAAPKMGGIVRLTGFIIKTAFVVELTGALLLSLVFCQDYGINGIWMALFHSISAFCNAGFDLMGTTELPYASLTSYIGHPLVNIAIILLIMIGGIGFLTWDDIRTNRLHFRKYRMQSKVIVMMTGILIFIPTAYFFLFEFADLPLSNRIFSSIFQAVTPRTAGFNTADLTLMSGAGQSVLIMLMLIGGAPGSTAGGMKTTTIAVLFANTSAVFRRKADPHLFGRRLEGTAIRNASTILMMYITLFFGGAFLISTAENLPMGICLFETASAIGTVGLTLGITPSLGILSRIILILLMFFGRVGGLTLIYAVLSGNYNHQSKLPQERIIVG